MSVITPTHADRARRLQSALASIWAQEGLGEQFDVEPIVVDNASSGPTEEVVRRFPGTRYIRLEANRGTAGGLNAGLREATGTYMAFLDDDDLWLPKRLSIQVPVMQQAERVEVVYSQLIHMAHGTSTVAPYPEGPSGWIFEAIFKAYHTGVVVNLLTVLVPREVFDTVGTFDERDALGSDTDMWLRIALEFPFTYVPGPVAVYEAATKKDEAWHDEKTRSWLMRRDKILGLIHGSVNEAELRQLVLRGTRAHLVAVSLMGGDLEEARRRLLQAFEECPALDTDDWYASRMHELTLELARAGESFETTESLCAEIKRTQPGKGVPQRLRTRAFLADIWAGVAMEQASGRRDRTAAAAAARALLQNPRKVLSRPGLLRLLARKRR